MTDLPIEVQVRGQITPEHEEIRYEVEVTESRCCRAPP